jgi:hypothetical protein
MKKLVVFLFIIIFSISAFAQDGSLFTENFSLIKDPGANNRGFFNFKISFPSNYLFFTENRRRSRQHQTFQIFSFHQYSERTSLSRIATVEDGRQNWGDRRSLIYRQMKNMNSEEGSESLAERYLKRLAERSKKSRKTWGTLGLIGGGVFLGFGVALLSSADEEDGWGGFFAGVFGVMAIAEGTVMAGVGIYKLAIPSGAERKLDDVLSISDPGHRERASREALSLLAARGRRSRIISGILWAGLSAYALASNETGSFQSAAYFGGLAAYNFMRKSRAERMLQSYLKERELQNKLELRLGIFPYGGVKIGFVYSF